MSKILYRWGRIVPVTALVVAIAACQEQLAAPADCPALCPGGVQLRDTVLTPIVDGDTSFSGYRTAGQGTSLRVSYQFAASEDRAVIRFGPRSDSVVVGDSTIPYTSLDSIRFAFSLLKRDTSVTGLKIFIYRLPPTVDSTTNFALVDAAFVPSAIVDSFMVDDTTTTQRFITVYKGATLLPWVIPPADSGVIALGFQIRAASGTGVRIGGVGAGSSGPALSHFTTAPQDTTTVTRVLSPAIRFNTFVSQTTPVDNIDELTIGGVPSSRAILRFPWPTQLRDSAQLVRATLELVPLAPFPGLASDTAFLQVRAALADFGSKSPGVTDAFFISIGSLVPGASDTIRVEVRRAISLWQGANPLPSMFVLQLFPEVSSFTRAVFGSTRTPASQARLRITYALPYPFEAP